jgi:hypothetical protein
MEEVMVTMFRKYVFAVFVVLAGSMAHAGQQQQLTLFGAPIQGATRDQLRAVFKAHGIPAQREDDQHWVDLYDASGVLDGASQFAVGYVGATEKFAYAEYTFKSFMDAQQVARVINLVSQKYGAPSSRSGNISLGEVDAGWNFPGGLTIHVSRGWPDTTTYLTYKDSAAYSRLKSEMNAQDKKQAQQKAAAQSQAF